MKLYENLISNAFLLAGPCVIEDNKTMFEVAEEIVRLRTKYNIEIVFKSSFDKANRTSLSSYRGPGIKKGLKILNQIKDDYQLPIVTDIHESYQAELVAEVADIIQIPAFLCRQTDLLVAAANTGKIVNIKKAQFLSGEDMIFPIQKVRDSGNNQILLTERGNIIGANNLVVDFRNIPAMKKLGVPVIMDCTHAAQKPGGGKGVTAGNREHVILFAGAAKAFGADGYFVETHPEPDKGLSDAANMLELQKLEQLIQLILS